MIPSAPLRRILLSAPPYLDRIADNPWDGRGPWKAAWLSCADAGTPPFVTAYRLKFNLSASTLIRCHVTADERYELFLDGVRVGRGSERGDVLHWFYESYEGELAAGVHVIVARVWSLGAQAPRAQVSVRPGFLFAADDPVLSALIDTGYAPWDAARLDGYTFQSAFPGWGTGANVVIEGRTFPWDFEAGHGLDWKPAVIGRKANDDICCSMPVQDPLLTPAQLPPMLEQAVPPGRIRHVADIPAGPVSKIAILADDHLGIEAETWQKFLAGKEAVTIPPHTRRRVIIDLENYYCAYHQLNVSGGTDARIEIHWQESLYDTEAAQTKGNRDAVEKKFFITTWHLKDGIGDRFKPEGGINRRYESLWWHCGRYVQLLVETAVEPLALNRLNLQETRYPLERTARFSASDPGLETISPLAWRTLQVCAHETYFDCPYFEQLQYAGDTRLEALVTYVSTSDHRLPRKAVQLFDWSRLASGLTQSHYPSGNRQVIPAFSLLWIGMVHDYFMWRDDHALVNARLPGIRAVIDHWLRHVRPEGFIEGMIGWNYLDWVPAWKAGIPPDGESGGGASFNFMLQIALGQAAELEDHFGEPEVAIRWRRRAAELSAAARRLYWNAARGLFADDRAHQFFSEHAQSLAVLVDAFTAAERPRVTQALLTAPDLTRTTIYFTHYFFEALRRLGQPDRLIERLHLWLQLRDRGLRTTIEMPEPTRSDCHAWASHPLFHYHATLLGVRPASPGFKTVAIVPQLGPLTWAEGSVPHPRGEIVVNVRREGSQLKAHVTLPEGTSGYFGHGDLKIALSSGAQLVTLP